MHSLTPEAINRINIIKSMAAQGKSRHEIAKYLSMRVGTLQAFCSLNNVLLPVKTTHRNRPNKIAELTERGLSRDEIAKALNLKLTSLQEWCSRHRVSLPSRSSSADTRRMGNVIVRSSIPSTLADELKDEAEHRKVGVVDFTASILSAVAEGKLYNAVLEQ